MPDASARLALPYIQPSQAQKHVTHNEALLRLDAVTQLSLIQINASTPPGTPQDGDVYAIGPAPEGAWADQAGLLAYWQTTGWLFILPREGWRAWSIVDAAMFVYSDGTWTAAGLGADVQNASGVGIGTTSDTINRLAVTSEASLFSHAGTGHQVKVNKASPVDTASLLFQTGFSGRAEMGTAGSDSFAIKISLDGSVWNTALLLDPATQTTTISAAGTARITCSPAGIALTGPVTGDAVQSSSTDETQGRLMPVGAFGLGTYGSAGGRLSDAKAPLPSGFYEGNGGSADASTFPTSICRYGPVLNLVRSASNNMVRAFFDNDRPIICRSNDGALSWDTPNALYGTANILDPVSQTDGVPTGGILERGSNAQGEYIRFADGTVMATRTVTIDAVQATQTQGALFASTPQNFAFPVVFAAIDHVSASLKRSDNAVLGDSVVSVRLGRGAGATPGTWEGLSVIASQSVAAASGEETEITLFATGRWF